jgi:tRNA U55 pseudouridine synthase TruB
MARSGTAADLAPVDVRVDSWDVVSLTDDTMVARIACGGGTYIRALARDLGRAVDSAAHLVELRRERCGPFHVDEATTIEDRHVLYLRRVRANHVLGALVERCVAELAEQAAIENNGVTVAIAHEGADNCRTPLLPCVDNRTYRVRRHHGHINQGYQQSLSIG